MQQCRNWPGSQEETIAPQCHNQSAGVSEPSPAEMTSQHCLPSDRESKQRKTLLLHTAVFLSLCSLSLSVLSLVLSLPPRDHTARRTVKQQQASGRTAQTKQKDLEGLMKTAKEKEKGKCICSSVCVSYRTVPAHPHQPLTLFLSPQLKRV